MIKRTRYTLREEDVSDIRFNEEYDAVVLRFYDGDVAIIDNDLLKKIENMRGGSGE